MKMKYFLIIAIILLSGCGRQPSSTEVNINLPSEDLLFESDFNSSPEMVESVAPLTDQEIVATTATIPARLVWPVPFASQAPFGNWDEIHQEACEEASMIIVAKYFAGEKLNEEIMAWEIRQLIDWQNDRGYQVDLTAAETTAILIEYFGLSARLEYEVTVDRLKYELAQGNLIIIPAAGRKLGNPYFRSPGPIYHMLVVKGYNHNYFITNDVGTKRGESFRYRQDVLIDAIHDWDHDLARDGMTEEKMNQGAKVVIIVHS